MTPQEAMQARESLINRPIKTIEDFETAARHGSCVYDAGKLENAECYCSNEPCPICGVGIVYDADGPNGGGSQYACLNCGADETKIAWDESGAGEWRVVA